MEIDEQIVGKTATILAAASAALPLKVFSRRQEKSFLGENFQNVVPFIE